MTSSPTKAPRECSICLEPLDGSRAEVRLVCGHVFCLGCTATTINVSGYGVVRCSLCRCEEDLPTWLPCPDGDDDDSDYGEEDDISETMYFPTEIESVIMTGFSDADDDAGEDSGGDGDGDEDYCEDVDEGDDEDVDDEDEGEDEDEDDEDEDEDDDDDDDGNDDDDDDDQDVDDEEDDGEYREPKEEVGKRARAGRQLDNE